MGLIKKEYIRKVKEMNDILDVVGRGNLKASGKNHVGPCPFHNDTDPSLYVSSERQTAHCYGACGKSFDVIEFTMRRDGLRFPDAVKYLAGGLENDVEKVSSSLENIQYGFSDDGEPEVARDNPSNSPSCARKKRGKINDIEYAPNSERAKFIYEVTEEVQKYFMEDLRDNVGRQAKAAREYLISRDLGWGIADHFGIGFGGNASLPLFNHLESKFDLTGIECIDAMKEAGFLGARGDFLFSNRVTFPITSLDDKFIGVFARRFDGILENKYRNSMSSIVYSKNLSLLGLSNLEDVSNNELHVVEGPTDVIAVCSDGEHVVGTGSARISEYQIDMIAKMKPKGVNMMFDGGLAGISGSLKGANRLLERGLDVSITAFNDKKDPFDVFHKDNILVGNYCADNRMLPREFLYLVIPKLVEYSNKDGVSLDDVIENTSNIVERGEFISILKSKGYKLAA